jgi:ATP synthase protein I
MSETNSSSDDLKSRLAKAQEARKALEGPSEKTVERYQSISGAGLAMRFAAEFTAATLVGLAIGIALDGWFKTSPLFLLIMFGFGVAAGVLGGIRAYRNFNAELEAQALAQADDDKTNGTDTP